MLRPWTNMSNESVRHNVDESYERVAGFIALLDTVTIQMKNPPALFLSYSWW